MPLEFLKPQPDQAFRRLEEDLRHVNPKRDLTPFKSMTPRRLAEELKKLDAVRERMIHEHTYGEWLNSPKFAEMRLLQEALQMLHEHKSDKEESEMLIPGFAYYRGVKQFGTDMTGQRAYYTEGRSPVWGTFKENIAVLKARTVLAHGDADDFAKIYVELADGRGDALSHVTLEHITHSSAESLREIEEYCDERWSGPWPWELTAPYKLRTMIEDHTAMRQDVIESFHSEIRTLVRKLDEGEMEKYEVMSQMQDTADKIEKMITELGRIMGEGLMQMKTQATVSLGDQAADMVDQNLTEPLKGAAEALTELLTNIRQTMEGLEGGGMLGGDDMGGMDMGADMGMGGEPGMPGDMGEPVEGPAEEPDIAADMADVDLGGGDEGERIKKEV